MLNVTRVVPSCTEDGQHIILAISEGANPAFQFALEASGAFDFCSAIEEAARLANGQKEKALKGTDPRLFFSTSAKTVTNLGGSVAEDGTPILDIELNGGIQLSLALKAENLGALIEWLESLRDNAVPNLRKPN